MDLQKAASLVMFGAGALVSIESALVMLGMNAPSISSWSTAKNIALACTDIVLGGVLVFFSVSGGVDRTDWTYYACVTVLLLSHLYREVESLLRMPIPFAANAALFVFNNVRLGLLGACLAFSLWPAQ